MMRVTKSDVIHANPRHLPCIFKVTTGVTMQQLGSELLLLMDTQGEMEKWVAMLEELSKVVKSKQQSVSRCLIGDLILENLPSTDKLNN